MFSLDLDILNINMYKYIFGPVPSRRLGLSLGVDLVPPKICTIDCVYCECGKTTKLTLERKEYIKIEKLFEELKIFFKTPKNIDFITLTGSGEPTLNSRIDEVIAFSKQFNHKIALLTNGTLLSDEKVRNQIIDVDVVLPSYDAATLESFNKINRPHPEIDLNSYLNGLIEFRKIYKGQIWLEILILPGYNDDLDNLLKLREDILKINPDKIQLNTLDRPGALENLVPANYAQLKYIMELWNLPNVEIVSRIYSSKNFIGYSQNIEEIILETLQRRPCTIEDLKILTNLSETELSKYLSSLSYEKKIFAEKILNNYFYKTKN